MTSINLLPWREAARKERLQHFVIALGIGAVLAALMLVPVYFVIDTMVTQQASRNTYLEQQISVLDRKISEIRQLKTLRTDLIARMNVIQQLQADRTITVNLFNELVGVIPPKIYISRIEKQNAKFIVQGISDSNQSISQMMRKIEKSQWLAHPVLLNIDSKQVDGVRTRHFQLEMHQRVVTAIQQREDEF